MGGCVYNKATYGTCYRHVSRTTAISEMEFFVTVVNRGVLRIFTNTVKFKFQVFLTTYVKSYEHIMFM